MTWLWGVAYALALLLEIAPPLTLDPWAIFPTLPWMIAALSLEKDPVIIGVMVLVGGGILGWFTPLPWVMLVYPLLFFVVALALYRFFVSHRSLSAALLVLVLGRLAWGGLWWVMGWQGAGEVSDWAVWLARVLVWDVVLLASIMTLTQRLRRWLGRGNARLSSYESR